MPGKMAGSGPSTVLQLAGLPASFRTARSSCRKAEKAQIFTSVRDWGILVGSHSCAFGGF